jgi:hypothetical protein
MNSTPTGQPGPVRSLPSVLPQGRPPKYSVDLVAHARIIDGKNDKARQFYETTAIEKKWTRDELVKAIQADHFGEDPTKGNGKPPKQLKRPAGEPFIYRAKSFELLTGILCLCGWTLGLMCGLVSGFDWRRWTRHR